MDRGEAGQAAWLPDPYRRYQHRWWDGQRWTAQVSQQGVASVDPAGDPPPPPDLAAVEADALTLDLAQTGLEGAGHWGVQRPDGTMLGWVRVTVGGIPLKHSYELLDAAGTRVLTLNQVNKLASLGMTVHDAFGQHLGSFETSGTTLLLQVPPAQPGAVMATVGSAAVPELVWSSRSALVAPRDVLVVDGAGGLVAKVHVSEPEAPPGRYEVPPGPCSIRLERDPNLAAPLRPLVAALPAFLVMVVSDARFRQRSSARERRFG